MLNRLGNRFEKILCGFEAFIEINIALTGGRGGQRNPKLIVWGVVIFLCIHAQDYNGSDSNAAQAAEGI